MSKPQARATDQIIPGPWYIEERNDCLWIVVPADIGRKVIAKIDIGFDEPFESQQRAHARLIAAAPELYSICRDILDWVHGKRDGRAVTNELTARLRDAIDKVEDRS